MSRFLSLAGERLGELADLSSDEGRLSRGRALFRKGSVSDLVIDEGSATASVRGSGGDLYETTISTTLAPPGVRRQVVDGVRDGRTVDELIDDGLDVCPREIDLAFECDCPDWEEPCKHVVAVFLSLADRVDLDEAELLRWRGLEPPANPPPIPPSAEPSARTPASDGPRRSTAAPSRPGRPGSTERPEPADDTNGQPADGEDRTARLARLESLLGDTAVRVRDDGGGTGSGAEPSEPSDPDLDPAMAAFLGVGSDLEPPALGDLAAAAPLFTGVELGPLAQLGPELAAAMTIITDRLTVDGPER